MSISVDKLGVWPNCKAPGTRVSSVIRRRDVWRTCSSRLKGHGNVLNRRKVGDCSFVAFNFRTCSQGDYIIKKKEGFDLNGS